MTVRVANQIFLNGSKGKLHYIVILNIVIRFYYSKKRWLWISNFSTRFKCIFCSYYRGRIFLIFAHYNYFLDNGEHTGDTVAIFNDVLLDMYFGLTLASSHSLIQSATFDEFYFWTAALGDAYPQGIKEEYTSKT